MQFRLLFDTDPQKDDELQVHKGDIVTKLKDGEEEGWIFCQTKDLRKGLVPMNCVEEVEDSLRNEGQIQRPAREKYYQEKIVKLLQCVKEMDSNAEKQKLLIRLKDEKIKILEEENKRLGQKELSSSVGEGVNIGSMYQTVQELKFQIQQYQHEIALLKKSGTRKRINRLEKKLNEQKAISKHYKDNLSVYSDRLQAVYEDEISAVKEKLSNLQAYSDRKEKFFEETIERLQNDYKEQVERIKSDYLEKMDNISQQSKSDLEHTIMDLCDLKAKNEECEKQISMYQSEIQSLKDRNSELMLSIEDIEQSKIDLNQTMNDSIDQLQETIEERDSKHEKDIAYYQKINQQLTFRLEEKDEQFQQIISEKTNMYKTLLADKENLLKKVENNAEVSLKRMDEREMNLSSKLDEKEDKYSKLYDRYNLKVKELEGLIGEYEKRLQQKRVRYDQSIQALETSYSELIKQNQSEFMTKEKELRLMLLQKESKLEAMEKKHHEEMKTVGKKHHDETQVMEKKHHEEIVELKRSYEHQILEKESEQKEKLNHLKKEHKEGDSFHYSQLQELHNKYQTEIQSLKSESASEIQTLKKKFQVDIQLLKDNHASVLKQEKREYDSAFNTLKNNHASEMKSLISEHESETKKNHKNHESVIQNWENKYDKEIQSLTSKYTSEIQEWERKYHSEVQKWEIKYDSDLKTLKSRCDAEIQNLNNLHASEIKEWKRKYDSSMKSLSQSHELKVQSLNKEHKEAVNSLKNLFTKKENTLEKEKQSEIYKLKSQLVQEGKKCQELIRKHDETIRDLTEKHHHELKNTELKNQTEIVKLNECLSKTKQEQEEILQQKIDEQNGIIENLKISQEERLLQKDQELACIESEIIQLKKDHSRVISEKEELFRTELCSLKQKNADTVEEQNSVIQELLNKSCYLRHATHIQSHQMNLLLKTMGLLQVATKHQSELPIVSNPIQLTMIPRKYQNVISMGKKESIDCIDQTKSLLQTEITELYQHRFTIICKELNSNSANAFYTTTELNQMKLDFDKEKTLKIAAMNKYFGEFLQDVEVYFNDCIEKDRSCVNTIMEKFRNDLSIQFNAYRSNQALIVSTTKDVDVDIICDFVNDQDLFYQSQQHLLFWKCEQDLQSFMEIVNVRNEAYKVFLNDKLQLQLDTFRNHENQVQEFYNEWIQAHKSFLQLFGGDDSDIATSDIDEYKRKSRMSLCEQRERFQAFAKPSFEQISSLFNRFSAINQNFLFLEAKLTNQRIAFFENESNRLLKMMNQVKKINDMIVEQFKNRDATQQLKDEKKNGDVTQQLKDQKKDILQGLDCFSSLEGYMHQQKQSRNQFSLDKRFTSLVKPEPMTIDKFIHRIHETLIQYIQRVQDDRILLQQRYNRDYIHLSTMLSMERIKHYQCQLNATEYREDIRNKEYLLNIARNELNLARNELNIAQKDYANIQSKYNEMDKTFKEIFCDFEKFIQTMNSIVPNSLKHNNAFLKEILKYPKMPVNEKVAKLIATYFAKSETEREMKNLEKPKVDITIPDWKPPSDITLPTALLKIQFDFLKERIEKQQQIIHNLHGQFSMNQIYFSELYVAYQYTCSTLYDAFAWSLFDFIELKRKVKSHEGQELDRIRHEAAIVIQKAFRHQKQKDRIHLALQTFLKNKRKLTEQIENMKFEKLSESNQLQSMQSGTGRILVKNSISTMNNLFALWSTYFFYEYNESKHSSQ